MAKSQRHEYKVQSAGDKSIYYDVKLEAGEKGIQKASCTCWEYLTEGCTCEHIETARTCYVYGF